mmetsp:Transcript_5429/g.15959  ORF Transcript_5429/g.15959 Transcript_5429/m.15959 type:complete len:243 (+) Transcript_5429:2002-2730(+)
MESGEPVLDRDMVLVQGIPQDMLTMVLLLPNGFGALHGILLLVGGIIAATHGQHAPSQHRLHASFGASRELVVQLLVLFVPRMRRIGALRVVRRIQVIPPVAFGLLVGSGGVGGCGRSRIFRRLLLVASGGCRRRRLGFGRGCSSRFRLTDNGPQHLEVALVVPRHGLDRQRKDRTPQMLADVLRIGLVRVEMTHVPLRRILGQTSRVRRHAAAFVAAAFRCHASFVACCLLPLIWSGRVRR